MSNGLTKVSLQRPLAYQVTNTSFRQTTLASERTIPFSAQIANPQIEVSFENAHRQGFTKWLRFTPQ
jgi:hypothetical protein